jgi:hypothetical protein
MGINLATTTSVVFALCLVYLGYRIVRAGISKSFGLAEIIAISSVSMFVAALSVRIIYNDFVGLMHISKPVMLYDYMRVAGVSLLLSYMGLQIREDKPLINRAPVLLSFLPLLLIAVHPLVSDTILLKETLLKMYFGGALVVSLLYFSLISFKQQYLIKELIAVIVFFAAFLLFIFPGLIIELPKNIYVFVVCAGIIIMSKTFNYNIKQVNTKP